ncbi:sigma 54-dependent Fis family transcriptional regulator [Pseudenhygromyxa sp. WMMC2535]|uniref:sigma 54-interacting transcriptional regulator n=1 Tax=Pseudenhygromyxa sp. WMMC2535 TaxID=2712867 RepID=UPI001555A222|nr:sigma 54-interacting transcriptional regulator [Pseudenhygromyxa sp. WMMC2535]NVB37794.1 sigma 54-dependent Fis family transcriptional regulator [Pseudenhygromyxa sp. WMMC2535]
MSGDFTRTTRKSVGARTRETRPGRLGLKILDGPQAGTHVELTKPTVIAGRSPSTDLVLEGASVSKRHFQLRPTTAGAELRDLGSRNGLWFGGRRVLHMILGPGDVFKAGDCALELVEIGEVDVLAYADERCGELYGKSLNMRELFHQLERVAATPLRVLIQGETGTGKEVAARSLHQLSLRASQAFVTLDCSSLPETLADATLFGSVPGAFTGAAAREQPGLFEQADGGTLFIDEIGELSLSLQLKLLGVLERGRVSRLGQPGFERPIDVRVVAATNRDLLAEVESRRFRQDLYHRLGDEFLLTMPPLREREQDALLLAELFTEDLCAEYDFAVTLGPEARAALLLYPWPGNVRELRSVMRRAVLIKQRGELSSADLGLGGRASMASGVGEIIEQQLGYEDSHLAFDRAYLPRVLEEAGSIRAATKHLKIGRNRLRKRLKELGIYDPE